MVVTGRTAHSDRTGHSDASTSPTVDRPPSQAAKRGGYAVGATVNLGMLWLAHQLLGWGWPDFLTDDFEEVLPWITVSCLVSIAGYVLMFVRVDRLLPKLLNDAATAGTSFTATLTLLQVFPFDFDSHAIDWSWLIRTILIVALVGSALGFIVAAVKLATWPVRPQR